MVTDESDALVRGCEGVRVGDGRLRHYSVFETDQSGLAKLPPVIEMAAVTPLSTALAPLVVI